MHCRFRNAFEVPALAHTICRNELSCGPPDESDRHSSPRQEHPQKVGGPSGASSTYFFCAAERRILKFMAHSVKLLPFVASFSFSMNTLKLKAGGAIYNRICKVYLD